MTCLSLLRARSRCSRECAALGSRVSAAALETSALRDELDDMRDQLARMQHDLDLTREQLGWWPTPLTKYVTYTSFTMRFN